MRTGHLPQSVEWSVHVCMVLALLDDGELLPSARLAELYDLPAAYLAKAMQGLAAAGVVESIPGRQGGYRLAAAPETIPIGVIVRAAGLADSLFKCTEIRQRGLFPADPSRCLSPCGVAALMRQAQDAYLGVLDAVMLADLVVHGRSGRAAAWFTSSVHVVDQENTDKDDTDKETP